MSTSTRTAEDLAAELRKIPLDMEGWAQTILGMCAEKFEIVHVPPTAADGITEPAVYLKIQMAALPKLRKLMPDFREEVGTISVSGNVITFTHAAIGTRPDGAPFRMEGVYILTVENGKIAKIHVWHDQADMEALFKMAPAFEQHVKTTH